MSSWYEETHEDRVRFALRTTRMLHSEKSEYQRVDVFETEAFGRALAVDGLFMTTERDEFMYHEMLVHPPFVSAESIRRVLVIGGGDGGTVREVLRYPEVERVLMVEIDDLVVRASKEHLGAIGTAWNDPRLEVRIGDGIRFVAESDEVFDVALLDGTDPVGPAVGLFEESFYANVKKRLAPGGTFAMQSESPILFPDEFAGVQAKLKRLYAGVFPYLGSVPTYPSGTWSWTFASDTADPRRPSAERQARIEETTRYYDREVHGAAFVLPKYAKQLVAQATRD